MEIMRSLKYIFEPRSIAVIGASSTSGNIGNAIFSNILLSFFQGIVYPVNPKYSNILSVKAYSNVLIIPETIDLAIICVPKIAVKAVMKQCVEKGIKGIVIITAGFKEIGIAGKKLEDEIVALARIHNIALIGPNCLGIINTNKKIRLNANFAIRMPDSGNVGLISQSGAIGVAALEYASKHDLGISKFISIGNKALIDESDVLEYLIGDAETKIITMYAENIAHPVRFFELANRAKAKQKPIIIIKAGKSARGAMAIHSHTGALSSSDLAYDTLFMQCGVIRVETPAQLVDYAKGFNYLKAPKGNRIAIVTNGGGMGIIATDATEMKGLEMATFESSTLKALKKILPPTANINNPVDIIGVVNAQRLIKTLSEIVKDKNVDAIVVSITPTIDTDMSTIVEKICDFAKANPGIPISANIMSLKHEPSFSQLFKRGNLPNFDFPETNISILASMIKYYEEINRPPAKVTKFAIKKKQVHEILNAVKKEKRTRLSEPESYKLLKIYGMKIAEYRFVKNLNSVIIAADQIGYPVVLKIVSPDITHKMDIGGVKLNLKNENDLMRAFNEITESINDKKSGYKIHGFLVQKYFTVKSIEIILGANLIKGFGPLIMFGFGGTYVELFRDVAFRFVPLTRFDVLNMIMQTKVYRILKGFRAQPVYDIESIIDYILRLSQLLTDFPEIKELDLNPIKVLGDKNGLVIMDAKMTFDEQIN